MPKAAPEPINGNDVELHYGDTVESLPHRLDRMEREHRYVRVALVGLGLFLLLHGFGVPFDDLFPFLFQLIGL